MMPPRGVAIVRIVTYRYIYNNKLVGIYIYNPIIRCIYYIRIYVVISIIILYNSKNRKNYHYHHHAQRKQGTSPHNHNHNRCTLYSISYHPSSRHGNALMNYGLVRIIRVGVGPIHIICSMIQSYYVRIHRHIRSPSYDNPPPHPLTQFLITGDVYRRDEIDQSHYPIFHQMEGVNIMTKIRPSSMTVTDRNKYIENDLKRTLEGLIQYLFNCSTTNSSSSNNTNHNNDTDTTPKIQMRWRDDHFPFTDPSYELDI
jgi:hypothetical protein